MKKTLLSTTLLTAPALYAGTVTEGETLSGNYPDGDLEGTTTFQWFGSLDQVLDANDTAISGAIEWISVTAGVLAPDGFVDDRMTADTDLDGIPDEEETALVGNLDGLGEGDLDGDRIEYLLEIALDSNPTSPSDIPSIKGMGPADPNRAFTHTRGSDLPWLRCMKNSVTTSRTGRRLLHR